MILADKASPLRLWGGYIRAGRHQPLSCVGVIFLCVPNLRLEDQIRLHLRNSHHVAADGFVFVFLTNLSQDRIRLLEF